MAEPIRLLIVEDEPADAELLAHELRKSGFELDWSRVDTAEALRHRLADDPPDLVISDHAMPQFSSGEALEILQQSGRVIPFIVVSHAIGEEEAVGLIHRGAADYLMKDRLGRLGEAVRQAFERQRLSAAHVAAQEALLALNAKLERRVVERTADLEAANDSLTNELVARHRADEALHQLNEELEHRITARTADLVATNERLRALACELTVTEQRERKRLAAELHDDLAQLLALAQIRIGQLRPKLRSDGSEVSVLVGEIHNLLKKSAEYIRTLMAKLSPPAPDETELPAALTWLAAEMGRHGLAVEVRMAREHVPLPDDTAVLLFQSVRELLMNIVKHAATQRASVTLSIDDANRLQIEVADTGRGFELATLSTKSSSEHFGLFSLRERMDAMGGSFDIQSAPGQGTRARLTLPLQAERAVAKEVRSPPVSQVLPNVDGTGPRPSRATTSERIRVLLVDDHPIIRQGLRMTLEGYANLEVVGEAGDGEEALALAEHLRPTVVVMDINMPKMNGIEATAHLKARYPEIAVIGLSVNSAEENEKAMKKAGATSLIAKHTALEELYTAIRETSFQGARQQPATHEERYLSQ